MDGPIDINQCFKALPFSMIPPPCFQQQRAAWATSARSAGTTRLSRGHPAGREGPVPQRIDRGMEIPRLGDDNNE